MKRAVLTPVLALVVFSLANTVSPPANVLAQDHGGVRRAPQQAPTSDKKALQYVEAAAKRQGGEALARTGGLNSFRLEFGRVIVQRQIPQEDGSVVYGTDEAEALAIDWMRHADAQPSLKTRWVLNGRTTTRAVFGPRDYYWLHDGDELTAINAETHPADYEDIALHRRLSRTLLDVAVLRKLLVDGSVWKMVDDPYYPGVAVKRLPPANDSTALTFTLWLDLETQDPYAVRVEPIEKGASILHYRLGYLPGYPKIEGAKIRFPQRVTVMEQRIKEQEPKLALDLFLRKVAFNGVTEDSFKPPRTSSRGR